MTEIIYDKQIEHSMLVNEHVDYNVLLHVRIDKNGERLCEVINEYISIFDDEGTLIDQFTATLPNKYIEEALDYGNNFDIY